MPRAVELRLRSAIEDYVAAYKGDNPRAGVRGGANADLVKKAEALLSDLNPTDGPADTPGRRAAQSESPGRALDSAKERARELLAPAGANRAGAGDGDQ